MAETLSMALAELLRKADAEPDLDTLREGVRVMTQAAHLLLVARLSRHHRGAFGGLHCAHRLLRRGDACAR